MKADGVYIYSIIADDNDSALQTGEYPTSTVYSALKRLQKDGYVIYSDHYEIEDPFFKEWILRGM